jgi:hypothetical protein
MKKHQYKKGDRVEVFEDPITKTKREGWAVVVLLYKAADYYHVRFEGRGVWDRTYTRKVL